MHSNNNIVLAGKLLTLFILHIYLSQLMALFFAMNKSLQKTIIVLLKGRH